MYTLLWTGKDIDGWDRFVSKEEVEEKVRELSEPSPPKCNHYGRGFPSFQKGLLSHEYSSSDSYGIVCD